MAFFKRQQQAEAAVARSRKLLEEAEQLPASSSAVGNMIALSDGWLRHAATPMAPR